MISVATSCAVHDRYEKQRLLLTVKLGSEKACLILKNKGSPT